MIEHEAHDPLLFSLARITLIVAQIGISLGLFLAVFYGLFTVPALMMAGFFFFYLLVHYVRQRRPH